MGPLKIKQHSNSRCYIPFSDRTNINTVPTEISVKHKSRQVLTSTSVKEESKENQLMVHCNRKTKYIKAAAKKPNSNLLKQCKDTSNLKPEVSVLKVKNTNTGTTDTFSSKAEHNYVPKQLNVILCNLLSKKNSRNCKALKSIPNLNVPYQTNKEKQKELFVILNRLKIPDIKKSNENTTLNLNKLVSNPLTRYKTKTNQLNGMAVCSNHAQNKIHDKISVNESDHVLNNILEKISLSSEKLGLSFENDCNSANIGVQKKKTDCSLQQATLGRYLRNNKSKNSDKTVKTNTERVNDQPLSNSKKTKQGKKHELDQIILESVPSCSENFDLVTETNSDVAYLKVINNEKAEIKKPRQQKKRTVKKQVNAQNKMDSVTQQINNKSNDSDKISTMEKVNYQQSSNFTSRRKGKKLELDQIICENVPSCSAGKTDLETKVKKPGLQREKTVKTQANPQNKINTVTQQKNYKSNDSNKSSPTEKVNYQPSNNITSRRGQKLVLDQIILEHVPSCSENYNLITETNSDKPSLKNKNPERRKQEPQRKRTVKKQAVVQKKIDPVIQPDSKVQKNIETENKILHHESQLLINSIPKNFPRNLRNHDKRNYAEDTTQCTSDISTASETLKPVEKKVPIYKKIVKETEQKPKEDMYEFDEISPKENKTEKVRKRKSSMFEKNTHEIMQKLQKNEEKMNRKRTKKCQVTKADYVSTVNDIVKKVMSKVNHKNQIDGSKTKTATKVAVRFKENVINSKDNEMLSKAPVPEHPSANVQKNLDNHDKIEEIHSTVDYDDNFFGFDVPDSPIRISNRINILSDITLNPSDMLASPSHFDSRVPNANSTFVSSTPLKEHNIKDISNPWRFNAAHLRRNPYFIHVKKSGLPTLDQEMVLDHTIVEKAEQRCPKTPIKLPDNKTVGSPVQKSMLDYINTSVLQEKENLPSHQSTLFNYEEFESPVKNKNKDLTGGRVQTVKRNVLAAINENVPSNEYVELNKNSNENMDYFGFEDSFEDEIQNKPPQAKPSRVDFNILKKYPSRTCKEKPVKHVKIVEDVEEYEISQTEPNCSEESLTQEVDTNQVKLFEDPEEMVDLNVSPELKGKKCRRKRFNSIFSDISDDEKPRKKRKDAKTRAEEAEFEKWAAQFNSMCKEIDEHELEIE